MHLENPPQLPPHDFRIKIGAPVILLRNLRSVSISKANGELLLISLRIVVFCFFVVSTAESLCCIVLIL